MKLRIHSINTLTIFYFVIASSAIAQNRISLLRYNDDFSALKKDTLKKGLEHLKYRRFGNQNYISFGGELREQFQVYHNLNFGDVPPSFKAISTYQLWHRFMLHTNVELGNHFRLFAQLNNTKRFLNENPVIPEIDENQLSLHQAFAEVEIHDWKFRLGRQELAYGNNRLITVREGPNTRLTFDGVVVKGTFKNGGVDLFAVSKVISKQYVFDDESFNDRLIGIYGTHLFVNRQMGLDYFVLDFQSNSRKYNYQSGVENRLTYGVRWFSNFTGINFELEGSYQSGRFNDLFISAYNALVDVNAVVLPRVKGIIGLAIHAASGDRSNEDNKLNTYNLLYAKPAYGLAIPIGSTNIVSVYPYVKINPVSKFYILAQVFLLSRNSIQDGTYAPGMDQNRPRPGLLFSSTEKTLGEFYVVETTYQQTENVSFSFDASYFNAGSYTKATGTGKDITYLSLKATLKF